ncbi:MAG: hypothetical protein ACRDTG_22965 [Pseudonocardiaceae bacterium]
MSDEISGNRKYGRVAVFAIQVTLLAMLLTVLAALVVAPMPTASPAVPSLNPQPEPPG